MAHRAITTGALHALSLATAFGGPLFGKIALNPAIKAISSEKERGKVLTMAWTRYGKVNLAAHLGFTATWLVGRNMLMQHNLDARTERLIRVKDVLIGGALLTGVASTVAGQMMRREFPRGVATKASGEPAEKDPAKEKDAERFHRFFRTVGTVNLVLIGAAIVVSPAILVSAIHSHRMSHRLFR